MSSSSLAPAFPSRSDCSIEFVPKIDFGSYSPIDCSVQDAPAADFAFSFGEFPLPVPVPDLPFCACPVVTTNVEFYSSSSEPVFAASVSPDSSLSCCKWGLNLDLFLPPIPSIDDICPDIDATAYASGDPTATVHVVSSSDDCAFTFNFGFTFPDYCPTITADGDVTIGSATTTPDVTIAVTKSSDACEHFFDFQFVLPDFCPDITATSTATTTTGSSFTANVTVTKSTSDCGFDFAFSFTMPDFQSQIDDIWDEIGDIWDAIHANEDDIADLSSSCDCTPRWQ